LEKTVSQKIIKKGALRETAGRKRVTRNSSNSHEGKDRQTKKTVQKSQGVKTSVHREFRQGKKEFPERKIRSEEIKERPGTQEGHLEKSEKKTLHFREKSRSEGNIKGNKVNGDDLKKSSSTSLPSADSSTVVGGNLRKRTWKERAGARKPPQGVCKGKEGP